MGSERDIVLFVGGLGGAGLSVLMRVLESSCGCDDLGGLWGDGMQILIDLADVASDDRHTSCGLLLPLSLSSCRSLQDRC